MHNLYEEKNSSLIINFNVKIPQGAIENLTFYANTALHRKSILFFRLKKSKTHNFVEEKLTLTSINQKCIDIVHIEPKRYEAGDEEEENLKSGIPKSQTIQDN